MDFVYLFVVLLVFMVIQSVGTYIQVRLYKNAVRRQRKNGNVGIGGNKKALRRNIVIFSCDNQGIVVDGEILQGLTMFNSFKKIPDIKGKSIYELLILYRKDKKKFAGHINALEALVERLHPIVKEEI